MTTPQFLTDLLTLLFDLAVPAAMCTMVLAGLALRQEGGVNFQVGGSFPRWMLWSVIFLTLPQLLSWFAGQGIQMPAHGGSVTSPWLAGMEGSFTAMFLLAISSTVQMMQTFNSGSQFATTDMLASLWNFVSGTILPEAAGLAVVGAVINYARHRPVMPLIFSAFAFLSVSALWSLVQAMVR